MASQGLFNLSKEELVSRVGELEDKLFHQNELMIKVREYKHAYDEDFGYVVSAPIDALLKELLSNPEAFSIKEKERIIKIYSDSIEMRGFYNCLCWPIGSQLSKVKDGMIPLIRENAEFFSSLVGNAKEFKNKWLVGILQTSLNLTGSLCSNLENIENTEYGESEQFNLKSEIIATFDRDNKATGLNGGRTITYEFFFGDCSGTIVEMNRKSFRAYFLGNMIKNLHDHAFKDYDDFSTIPSLPKLRRRIFKNGEEKPAGTITPSVREKRVRISLKKDEKNEHRMNLVIENNGNMFYGDVNDVFEKGIGEGEGEHIGLYSVRQFLKAYGATIMMYTDPDNEEGFKVGFKINIPIL